MVFDIEERYNGISFDFFARRVYACIGQCRINYLEKVYFKYKKYKLHFLKSTSITFPIIFWQLNKIQNTFSESN